MRSLLVALALLVLGSSCLGCAGLRVSRAVKPATTLPRATVVRQGAPLTTYPLRQTPPLTTNPRRQAPDSGAVRRAVDLGSGVPDLPGSSSDPTDRERKRR
ncbi:MAG: hypothetical protein AMXMBFR33_22160 [Candidatus Xenobia bacterium]